METGDSIDSLEGRERKLVEEMAELKKTLRFLRGEFKAACITHDLGITSMEAGYVRIIDRVLGERTKLDTWK